MASGRRPERVAFTPNSDPFAVARNTELDLFSSRRGDAREDALRPCLTCRTLLSTTLAETLTLMYLQQMPDAARRGDAAPYDHS